MVKAARNTLFNPVFTTFFTKAIEEVSEK